MIDLTGLPRAFSPRNEVLHRTAAPRNDALCSIAHNDCIVFRRGNLCNAIKTFYQLRALQAVLCTNPKSP